MEKTVLIVDDYEFNTFAVGHALQRAGYKIFKASSGMEALKYFDSNKIDLVVTDYNMPGMNGPELIQNIRNLPGYQTVPIIMLTAQKSEEEKKEAQDAGILAWVQKPFDLPKFIQTVKGAIG